jgi:hypothetical protein
MHNLQAIKNVAAEAMDDEDPGAVGLFPAVVGPESVLEMAAIIQVLLEEVERSGSNPELVDQVTSKLRGGFTPPQNPE